MKYFVLYILTFNIAFSSQEDIERYLTCYKLFTGEAISVSDTIMASVVNGQKTGTEACKELLATANLGTDNEIAKDAMGNHNSYGVMVMKRMNQLHRSFFEVPSYMDLSQITSAVGEIEDVYDENTSAYYWTYYLFKPNSDLSNILKSNFHYRSIRKTSRPQSARNSVRARYGFNLSITSGWNPPLAPLGLLVGLKQDTESFTLTVNPNGLNSYIVQFNPQNANIHHGAGIIGSQVYLFGNVGRFGTEELSTGGAKLYRRWSQHVLSDMLCKELPALRVDDIISEVQTDSDHPFRKSASCMQCHSTIDPMAGNVRNVYMNGTNGPGRPLIARKIASTEPSSSSILPRIGEDSDFSKRPPIGRVKYRSYDGTLVTYDTADLQSLGNFLSSSNDFYVCTARKYYEFLTGIKANLTDILEPGAAQLNATETYHRNKVIELGLELKTHKQLQKLIEDIVKTNTFLRPTANLGT